MAAKIGKTNHFWGSMPLRKIQPSFSGGEYSPSIYPRVDITKYQTGLKRLRNFIVHPQGGVSNRPGTRYVADAKYSDKDCIVQEFVFSSTQKFVLEIGDQYIRFYTAGSQVNVDAVEDSIASWNNSTAYEAGDYVTYNGTTVYFALQDGTNKQPDTQTDYWAQQTIYEIPTPYLEADLYDLRFEPSADVIWITHPSYKTRTLSRYATTDWRLEEYFPLDGPFRPENIDETASLNVSATSGDVTLSATAAVFASGHVGSIWKLRHYIEGQTYSASLSSATSGTAKQAFRTWRLITHGTWTAQLQVEKSTDGGSTWTVIRAFSSVNDFNVNTSGTEDAESNPDPFLVRVRVTSYTSGTIQVLLSTDSYYQEGIVQITAVNAGNSADATVLRTVGATTDTTSWAEGAWSDYRGWPSVARFFQDRLAFAGTPTDQMTVWFTQTSNYYSMRVNVPLLDTDAITANIPSRQVNIINGLVAFKRLLVFTSQSIWSIGPVSGSAMTPTGFTQEIEEYNGSNGVNPVVIGTEAIYIKQHGHVVSNIAFQLASDSFVGADANILALHLFDEWTILDMAYQRDPSSIIWMLRSDGHLVGMTYLRDQEVVAFHEHDTGEATGDQFKSLCAIPADNFDEVWFSTKRANGRYIERMVARNQVSTCGGAFRTAPEEQIHMDCAVSVYRDEATINATATDADSGSPTVTLPSGHGFAIGDSVFIPCNGSAVLQCVQGVDVGGGGGSPDDYDVALALLVDSSTSVDDSEFALQMQGYADAFRDTDVIAAIEGNPKGKVIVCLILWAGTVTSRELQSLMIPWTEVNNSTTADALATLIEALISPRPTIFGLTAPGSAINFAIPYFDNDPAGFESWNVSTTYIPYHVVYYGGKAYRMIDDSDWFGQDGFQPDTSPLVWEELTLPVSAVTNKIIDLSTDGIQNNGDDTATARDAAEAAGIKINGLGISAFDPAVSEAVMLSFLENTTITSDGVAYNADTTTVLSATMLEKITAEVTPCDANSFLLGDIDFSGIVYGQVIRKKATDALSNLDHLSLIVSTVLADGQAIGTTIVSASGAYTPSVAASVLHIGIPFTSDFETLNIEVPMPDGTMQGRPVKIANVVFRVIKTRGGYIGPDEDNLHEAFTTTNLTGAKFAQLSAKVNIGRASLYTGDIREPLGAGYSKGGRIFYRQVDPLPVTISCVIPEISAFEQSARRVK